MASAFCHVPCADIVRNTPKHIGDPSVAAVQYRSRAIATFQNP